MKIAKKKISELKKPEKNIRLHSKKQINEFKRSIEMFGQIRPIVIDENNVILAGNGLYETLLEMGAEHADCYVVNGLNEKQKKKLMLADNKIFNLGVDDSKAFDEFIIELKDDLDIPGFDQELLMAFAMDEKDANIVMSDYGLVTEEKKEEIKLYEERKQEKINGIAEKSEEYIPKTNEEIRKIVGYEEPFKNEGTNEEYKYVVCPRCGERIWL